MKSTRRSIAVTAASDTRNGICYDNSVAERIMKLKKWREERDEKRAAEKASKKPVFRASMNLEIPPVTAINSDWRTLTNRYHKYNAPTNIKPIAQNYGTKKWVDRLADKSLKDNEESMRKASIKTIRKLNHNLYRENIVNEKKNTSEVPGPQLNKITKQMENSLRCRMSRQSLQRQESSNFTTKNKENIGKELVTNKAKSKKLIESAGKITEKVMKNRKSLSTMCTDSKLNDNIGLMEKVEVKVLKTQKTATLKITKANEQRSVGRPSVRCLTHVKIKDAKNIIAKGDKEQNISVNGVRSEVNLQDITEEEKFYTPENKDTESVVYVSPFVTMSRGKKCARTEYNSRVSKGGRHEGSSETSAKSGAAYFYKLLDDEIARITGLCNYWEKYKIRKNLPEEAVNMINVPIGQSNLLISKKMQQFRALVDKAFHSTDSLSVTCADLHGFWDTVMIQVSNLNKRFDNLVSLRSNNWEDVLPRHGDNIVESSNKPPKPKQRVMPKRGVKQKNQPVSKIRDAIRAAKAGQNKHMASVKQGGDGPEFNGRFFTIKSPVKSMRSSPRRTPKRNNSMSLLKSALNPENRKSIKGSSGLPLIKVNHSARINSASSDWNLLEDITPLKGTPTKSILKLSALKSTVKKTVVFNDSAVESLIFEPLEYNDEE